MNLIKILPVLPILLTTSCISGILPQREYIYHENEFSINTFSDDKHRITNIDANTSTFEIQFEDENQENHIHNIISVSSENYGISLTHDGEELAFFSDFIKFYKIEENLVHFSTRDTDLSIKDATIDYGVVIDDKPFEAEISFRPDPAGSKINNYHLFFNQSSFII